MITYPLDFTELLVPARIEWRAEDVVGFSESPFTRAQQLYAWDADLLALTVTFPPCLREDAEELVAQLLALRGMEGTFLLRPFGNRSPRGSGAAETPVVDGGDQAGAQLATTSWTPSGTNLLKRGDWFGVTEDGIERLHKVLSAVDADANGDATLDIWPRLRAAPADAAALTLVDPVGRFRLASNARRWSVEEAVIYGLSFDAIEDLSA
jgi:hypothetical protein